MVATIKLIYTSSIDENVRPAERAMEDLRNGRFILVYDADGREEETDLCIASEHVRPESIKTMRKDAGGWICTTIPPRLLTIVDIPILSDVVLLAAMKYPFVQGIVPPNLPYDHKSAFSLTISHRDTYTGVTDKDRALTIKRFAEFAGRAIEKENGWAMENFGLEFRSPGHVPLLRPSIPLLESRHGHTELTTALATMSGPVPSTTICEMLGDDGNSLTKDKAKEYALTHNLAFLEGWEILEAWHQWSR